MNRTELLTSLDAAWLDRLFGFCYARTRNSYEAQELCSDIVFALARSSEKEGEIVSFPAFVWRVARNVYADFSEKRHKSAEISVTDEVDGIPDSADEEEASDTGALMRSVYRQIAFLTRAYREVFISYYFDGKPISHIAAEQGTSENAIRQRLFSARKTIREGVNQMKPMTKPIEFQPVHYAQWGTGNPLTGNPWGVCTRQLSLQVVNLCRKRPMTPAQIAEQLHVPTVYVEEELAIQTQGQKGGYGLLREEGGKYMANVVLLSAEEAKEAWQLYLDLIPQICDAVRTHFAESREQYLTFPYLNHRIDPNLVLWYHTHSLADKAVSAVSEALEERMRDITLSSRPYTAFGYELRDTRSWGGGWDGIYAENICGMKQVHLNNLYNGTLQPHFHCGHNIATDPQLQLAIRAISGIDTADMTEPEKETAARAIEAGYLEREGDMLYTRILAAEMKDVECLWEPDRAVCGALAGTAEVLAEKLEGMIRRILPPHLLPDWRYFASIASLPVVDSLIESLIATGDLVPPENGLGAEGVFLQIMY